MAGDGCSVFALHCDRCSNRMMCKQDRCRLCICMGLRDGMVPRSSLEVAHFGTFKISCILDLEILKCRLRGDRHNNRMSEVPAEQIFLSHLH